VQTTSVSFNPMIHPSTFSIFVNELSLIKLSMLNPAMYAHIKDAPKALKMGLGANKTLTGPLRGIPQRVRSSVGANKTLGMTSMLGRTGSGSGKALLTGSRSL
jgi:hypothetical protein